jgi:hypothetical protein
MEQLTEESLNNIIYFCDRESIIKFKKVSRLWKLVFIKNYSLLKRFIIESEFSIKYLKSNEYAINRLISLFGNNLERLLEIIDRLNTVGLNSFTITTSNNLKMFTESHIISKLLTEDEKSYIMPIIFEDNIYNVTTTNTYLKIYNNILIRIANSIINLNTNPDNIWKYLINFTDNEIIDDNLQNENVEIDDYALESQYNKYIKEKLQKNNINNVNKSECLIQ